MWPFSRKEAAPQERKAAGFFLALGSARGGLSGAQFDRLALEGYSRNVVAFRCVNLVANALASVEPQLYKKGKAGLEKVENHELLTLIERPNAAQSCREFLSGLASDFQVGGNAYVLGTGLDKGGKRPGELQPLNPGKVRVEPGPGFFPARYEYRPNASVVTAFPVDQVTGRSAVLHLKTYNPLSPWCGLSPITAAAFGIDQHNQAGAWNQALLQNGARPSGALVVKDSEGKAAELSEEQYARLKEQIDAQFAGAGNSGRPLLLESGLEWQEMSLNPKDMDFIEGKHSAARDIALAFGVPPMLLGIPGDATYSNMFEAKLALWTDTVLPMLGLILDGFNRWLVPLYGDDLYFWYDEENIPALEPLRKQKADRIEAARSISINEKRRAMGYDDTEGGDVILVESSQVPLELVGEVDLSEPGSPADQPDKPGGDDTPEEDDEG